MTRRVLLPVVAGVLAACLTACGAGSSGSAYPVIPPHTHTGLPAGDGTTASYVGFTLAGLTFPTRSGTPEPYSFHIETYRGKPLTNYVVDLTKKMHVYVVSTDLSVFRHLHPTMAADGTWSGEVTLPQDGQYRLITEFITPGDGGNKDQLFLGAVRNVGVPTERTPLPAPATESTASGITVRIENQPTTGFEHHLKIGIEKAGAPASLGSYLGVYAHVSAFEVKTGGLVHMHPLGAPITQGKFAVLDFHTAFDNPGDYRMFVQVRISGIVWTVPITVLVTGQPAPGP